MGIDVGVGYIPILPDMAGFEEKVAAGTEKAAGSARIKTAGKALGTSFVAAAAGITAIGISRLLDSERVDKQIAAREKSTRESAGVTGEHIDKLSAKLLNMSGVDDEATKSSAALLLTFRDIKNEGVHRAFDETTKAILNVATAMNNGAIPSAEQLKATTIQVGKAVNDPTKGLASLRRIGVSFTDQQEEQVKALVASGKQYKAQKIVLSELNKEFAGSAKVAGTSLQGELDKTKYKFENLASELVKGLIPVFEKITEVAGEVVGFFEEHKDFAKVFLAGLAGVGTALLIAFGGPITAGVAALAALTLGITEAWKHSETFRTIVTTVAADAKRAFAAALPWIQNALKNTIAALKDAAHWTQTAYANAHHWVEGVVSSFKTFWKESAIVRTAAKLIWEGLKLYFGLMRTVVTSAFSAVVNTAKREWAAVSQIFKGAYQVVKGVVEVFSGLLTGHFGRALHGVENIFSGGFKAIMGIFKSFIAPIKGQVEVIGGVLGGAFEKVWDTITGVFEDGVNAVAGYLQDLANIINPLLSAVGVGEIHITGEVAKKHAATGTTSPGKHGAKGQNYAQGGPVTVPGTGNRDTVPLAVNGAVNAVVAPGEQLIVANSQQQEMLGTAVQQTYGVGGLGAFFNQYNRPHYLAGGGFAHLPHYAGGFLGTGVGPSLGEVANVVDAPVRIPAEAGIKLFNTAKNAAEFIGGLPGLPSSLTGMFGEIGSAVLGKVKDWIGSLPGSIFGGSSSNALSGGSTASALEFAQYMLQAGFPASAKVISEGLGTIKSESNFEKNVGQLGEPEAHIGPWAESPAFGSVKTRLDPLGSTEAAYKEWAADGGFYQAWGQYEAGQSGLRGGGAGTYGPEFVAVANQAIREASGRTGSKAAKKANHNFGGDLTNGEAHALLLKTHGLKRLAQGGMGTAARAVQWALNNEGRGPHWGDPPGGWCGEFIGADMKAMGITPPSDYAFSEAWANWGQSVSHSEMAPGDILDYNDTHVAMYIGNGEQIQGNDANNSVGKSGIGSSLGLGPLSAISRPPYKEGSKATEKNLNHAQETVHTFKEDVPAEYGGVRTNPKFGPVPKSLENVEKEIRTSRGEMSQYRKATAHAKKEKRPAIVQALEAAQNELQSYIAELTRTRSKMKREIAQRKFTRKVTGKLAKLNTFNEAIAEKERAFNVAEQSASQIVGLEPVEPRVPRNATEAQREAAEKAYDEQYNEYVLNKEKPAYLHVLGTEAGWRNEILRGENFATELEGNWEDKIIGLDHTIDHIEHLKRPDRPDKPNPPKGKGPHPAYEKQMREYAKALKEFEAELKHYEHEQARLPMLTFEDKEVKKGLVEARGDFFGGGAKVRNPAPPVSGSGTLEEGMIGLQGIHWPGQHEFLENLPAMPKANMFGGTIYGTQETIAGLELLNFEAGPGEGSETQGESAAEAEGTTAAGVPEESELERAAKALTERELTEERTRNRILSAQLPVFSEFGASLKPTVPFGGVFHSGGVVPGAYGEERMILAQGGETVIPLDAEGTEHHVHVGFAESEFSKYLTAKVEKVNTGNGSKARRKNNLRAGR